MWGVIHAAAAYAERMEVHSLAEALAVIMERNGWTQTELARELGVSQSWVSRHTAGKSDTSTRDAAGLLARVHWELVIRPKREVPVKRREFMANVAAVTPVTLVPSRETNPYRDHEYVRDLAGHMTETMYAQGGVASATAAIRHLSKIKPALTTRDKRLQSASSELARKAMLVLYDAQRMQDAEKAGALAVQLARRAKDHSARLDAYRELSMISAFQGKGELGAQYAGAALGIAKNFGATDVQRAGSLMRLGRALGLVPGKERRARANLDAARSVDGLSLFEKADLLGGVGVALKEQRLFTLASDTLDQAVTMLGGMSPLLQANYLARRVQSALDAGNLDEAAEFITTLTRVSPLVVSARLDNYMVEIDRQCQRWANSSEIRNVHDQLRAVLPE